MQGPTRERRMSIDALKAISIFGVLVIHTLGGGFSNLAIGSFDWYSAVFWGSLIRFAVPVFFMCSGSLLLDPEKEISFKSLYTKYIPRILAALVFWALAYEAYDIGNAAIAAGSFDYNLVIASQKNMVLFRHHFHLYFLHIMILVYIFLPVTRILVKNASKPELNYILAIWFLLGIVFPRLRQYYPFSLLSGIPAQYGINMTYSAVGYGILGYYLHRFRPKKVLPMLLIFLAGFAVTFGGTIYLSLANNRNMTLWEGMSPGVALMATGLFGFLTCLFDDKSSPGPVRELSLASFCIYLVHDFFNQILRYKDIMIHNFKPVLVSIPVISSIVLLASYLVYLVLRKIPLVNKYLI